MKGSPAPIPIPQRPYLKRNPRFLSGLACIFIARYSYPLSSRVTFNLTPELIHKNFAEKPAVRKAYMNFVPNNMTEKRLLDFTWNSKEP
ncbi:hypothetical protein Hdeb2414_s0001g00014351 [Helianthus debilis subsp. tardiflorus]